MGGGGSSHSKNSSLSDLHICAGLDNAAPCRYCCHTMPQLWETHPAPSVVGNPPSPILPSLTDTPATEFSKEHFRDTLTLTHGLL